MTMRRDGLAEQDFLTQENSLTRFSNFPSSDPDAPGLRSTTDKFSAVASSYTFTILSRGRAAGGMAPAFARNKECDV